MLRLESATLSCKQRCARAGIWHRKARSRVRAPGADLRNWPKGLIRNTSSEVTCSLYREVGRAGTGALPPNVKSKTGHPVPRLGINGVIGLIQTNKFPCELLLGFRKDSTTLSYLTASP
jgi:hypothetical protein